MFTDTIYQKYFVVFWWKWLSVSKYIKVYNLQKSQNCESYKSSWKWISRNTTQRRHLKLCISLIFHAFLKLPYKITVKKKSILKLQQLWNAHVGSYTFNFFPIIKKKFQINNLLQISLLTNHGQFQSYLHKFGKYLHHCGSGTCSPTRHYTMCFNALWPLLTTIKIMTRYIYSIGWSTC